MEFPVELFDKASVEGFGKALVASAKLISEKPEITLAELTAANLDEQKLLAEWNNTAREFTYQNGVLGDWANAVAQYANQPAVKGKGGEYSYAQLESRSNRLARQLQQQGVTAGQSVGLLLERTCDLPAIILAIWKLGAAYVPLDSSYPVDRVQQILSRANATAVVTYASFNDFLGEFGSKLISIESLKQDLDSVSDVNMTTNLDKDQLAYVIFTSGSTGQPKGVEITHGALHNFLNATAITPGIKTTDRLLAITTLAFDISLLEIFLPLISGASLVIAEDWQSQDDLALRDLLENESINLLQATPATWRLLLSSGWKAPENFRAFCGGEKLARDLAKDLLNQKIELWNLYGPTEATVWTSAYQVIAAANDELPSVFLGRPLANTQLHVLDDTGRPLPIGAYGELWIGGSGLARGYLGDETQTQARFTHNREGKKLYRTGDLARWNRHGQIEFVGRVDNQIKLRGFRIELEEIEMQLRKHSAIKDAVVVLQDFSATDHRLHAFVVYQTSEEPTASELRRHLRQALPDYMMPQQFTALAELPLLASGKINRKLLAQPVSEVKIGHEYIAASTATEKVLVDIWQTALKRDKVSVDSQFFDIGGHSLLALEVILEMEAQLGVRFNPQDMWVNTLEQMAAKIDLVKGNSSTTESIAQVVEEKTETKSEVKTEKGLLAKLFGKK
jgi:amino acid adenylation domain-containing protein